MIRGTGCAIPSDTQVAAKWVRGTQAIESLRQEATMYDNDLRPLQGSSVPTFFGMFTGVHDGVDLGCLVLEWCPGNGPVADGKPTDDVLHMRAQAVRSLHDAGVHHGQLYERPHALCVSDGRHFLRAKDGTIRIVDFQRATRHHCVYRSDEIEGYGSFDSSECQELAFAAEYSHRAYMEGQLQSIPWNAF
ncbi:hypothetical protein K466DRAFT_501781 [Polyporus arcularius HHB13444]|uniref:Protein kinase domain-containing protein n=1 Tax=Polyporus arcularius HHB13444 TaxID=1314778 RepID=A0A5C3NWI2_9APHY|nr:hypothetical protein K466DRAFT_501781 [Polyporus arcularius HHB13444]